MVHGMLMLRGEGGDVGVGEGGDVGSICVGRGIAGEALPNCHIRKWKADSVRGLLIVNSGSTAEPFCSIAVRLFGIGASSLWLIQSRPRRSLPFSGK